VHGSRCRRPTAGFAPACRYSGVIASTRVRSSWCSALVSDASRP